MSGFCLPWSAVRSSCRTVLRTPHWSIKVTAAIWAPPPWPPWNAIACRGLKPHLTLLVDVDAEASLARARARNAAAPHCETRLDDESLDFHRRVWEAYHALAASEPERVKIVNGRNDIDTIEREVWDVVEPYVR